MLERIRFVVRSRLQFQCAIFSIPFTSPKYGFVYVPTYAARAGSAGGVPAIASATLVGKAFARTTIPSSQRTLPSCVRVLIYLVFDLPGSTGISLDGFGRMLAVAMPPARIVEGYGSLPQNCTNFTSLRQYPVWSSSWDVNRATSPPGHCCGCAWSEKLLDRNGHSLSNVIIKGTASSSRPIP